MRSFSPRYAKHTSHLPCLRTARRRVALGSGGLSSSSMNRSRASRISWPQFPGFERPQAGRAAVREQADAAAFGLREDLVGQDDPASVGEDLHRRGVDEHMEADGDPRRPRSRRAEWRPAKWGLNLTAPERVRSTKTSPPGDRRRSRSLRRRLRRTFRPNSSASPGSNSAMISRARPSMPCVGERRSRPAGIARASTFRCCAADRLHAFDRRLHRRRPSASCGAPPYAGTSWPLARGRSGSRWHIASCSSRRSTPAGRRGASFQVCEA